MAYLGADIQDETIPGTAYKLLREQLLRCADTDSDKIVLWYRDLNANFQKYPADVSTKITRDESQSTVSFTVPED